MQNQILKGVTMLLIVAAVALMAALVSAHAQSRMVVADVPFEFAVGNKSLTAGEYSVRAFTNSGDAVLISNKDSHDGVIRLTRPIQARIVPERAKLVFHRYGQRYFLSEIWTPGEQTGRQLLKSAEERALENQLAALPSKSELARSSYERVEILAMVR
ncbi:MAG: hypothetical protein ND866_26070 [Pyrinomonadaceae bacterium]|nr:hypothetical protein [Pyrinomonadaceae bacterium]